MKKDKVSFGFIALMALMMSFVAFSIDMMLPALAIIGNDFNINNENDIQLIISLIFAGIAAGQLFFGPLSDSWGRKPAIYLGFVFFFIGSGLIIWSENFTILLLGRFIQGFGLASPRLSCMAIIRDQFRGEAMARIMSFIMSFFILVPMIAPSLGQLVLNYSTWRAIFILLVLIAVVTLLWFHFKQKETLLPENRQRLSFKAIKEASKFILTNRTALIYTLIGGLISGGFIGYLNSAPQVFQELYDKKTTFALLFAVLAFSVGIASLFNGRFVVRIGMRKMTHYGLIALSLLSFIALTLTYFQHGKPEFIVFMVFMFLILFSIGILFGNLNSIAMEPLGKYAGTGAAVVGAFSTFIATPIAIVIGQYYDKNVLPIFLGFFITALLSIFLTKIEKNKN